MKTIVLRYSDSFAPADGTLAEHEKLIKAEGYAWWGKKGPKISPAVVRDIMKNEPCRIILVRGASKERYWATVEKITDGCTEKAMVPEYYRADTIFYGSFLKIVKIERAEENVLSKCFVCTTGKQLSEIINKAMASYYIVDFKDE